MGSRGKHNLRTAVVGPSPQVVLVRGLRTALDGAASVHITKEDLALGVEAVIGEYERKTGKVD